MVLIIEKCLILYNNKEFGLLDYKFMYWIFDSGMLIGKYRWGVRFDVFVGRIGVVV